MSGQRIACLGECMLELSQAAGGQTRFGFGGDTLNTAVYMARALEHESGTVSYVTALGTDPFSDEMVRAWQAEGVDCTYVSRLENALPGLYLIATAEAGERSFFYWREQAAVRALLDDGRDQILADALVDFNLIYIPGISLAVFAGDRRDSLFRLLEGCAHAGVRIAFDTNYRPRLWQDAAEARACYERIGRICYYALPSLDDELVLFGEGQAHDSLKRWRDLGASEVVVKAGAHACHIDSRGHQIEIPPQKVERPVDTTAAGDAFAAAYLVGRLLDRPPEESANAAHRLAGEVIMHPGAIIARD